MVLRDAQTNPNRKHGNSYRNLKGLNKKKFKINNMDKDILQSVIKMISKYNQGNNVNKKKERKTKIKKF